MIFFTSRSTVVVLKHFSCVEKFQIVHFCGEIILFDRTSVFFCGENLVKFVLAGEQTTNTM